MRRWVGAYGTALPVRMISEETSECSSARPGKQKGMVAPHPTKLFAAVVPPAGGEPARRRGDRSTACRPCGPTIEQQP